MQETEIGIGSLYFKPETSWKKSLTFQIKWIQ
jgi:hypothetical protein